jgi:hypothetical protein
MTLEYIYLFMTISVVMKGRLGNQLFQYATLRSIGLKNNYNINPYSVLTPPGGFLYFP